MPERLDVLKSCCKAVSTAEEDFFIIAKLIPSMPNAAKFERELITCFVSYVDWAEKRVRLNER